MSASPQGPLGPGSSRELAPGLRTYWDQALPRLLVHEVSGESMVPTLWPGDLIYADPQSEVAPGDLVVVQHPFRPLRLVKRLEARTPSGRLRVLGDHVDATATQDSRGFGPLKPAALEGRVVLARRKAPLGGDLATLAEVAPEHLRRDLSEDSLRLAGEPDAYGCEAHLEVARGEQALWLTASPGGLPWLSAGWLRSWVGAEGD
jgi:nickel-type superoxide dismutase maturation protease